MGQSSSSNTQHLSRQVPQQYHNHHPKMISSLMGPTPSSSKMIVFGLGSNNHQTFGSKHPTTATSLVKLEIGSQTSQFTLLQVSCGGDFAFFLVRDLLTMENRLFVSGYSGTGEHGVSQVGKGRIHDITDEIKQLIGMKNLCIIQACCGWNHSMIMVEYDEEGLMHGYEKNYRKVALYGTGFNNHGQLSVGNTSSINRFGTPADVSKIKPNHLNGSSRLISRFNTCAILSTDNTLYAAGNNGKGEMGRTGQFYVFEKIRDGVRDADFSYSHSMIITMDGKVWSSGSNDYGKLGHSHADSFAFLEASIPEPGLKVSLGIHHSIILTTSGSVYACGYNSHGELGIDSSVTEQRVFQKVNLDFIAKDVTSGFYHTCIISSMNKVYVAGVEWKLKGKKEQFSEIDTSACADQKEIADINAVYSGGYFTICYHLPQFESRQLREMLHKLSLIVENCFGEANQLQDVVIKLQ